MTRRTHLLAAALSLLLVACGGGGAAGDTSQATAPAPASNDSPALAQPAASTPAVASPPPAEPTTAAPPEQAGASAPAASAPEALPPSVKTYFVDSANGNDNNDGLLATPGANGAGPWRSLARLAQANVLPGEHVALACGSTWNETLRLATSGEAGKPILVRANPSGCSNPPAIDGSVAMAPAEWSLHQGNVYKARLAASPLQVHGTVGAMTQAHHPNRGHDGAQPASLYLAMAADGDTRLVNGRSVSQTLSTATDQKLPAGASLPAGTQIRVRTNAWVLDERVVAAAQPGSVVLDKPTTFALQAGWGYFYLGQLWMLDSAGEWHHDAGTQTLYAWMPDSRPPAAAVQATVLALGIDLAQRRHVVVDGLVVRKVGVGASLRLSTDVILRNCTLEDTASLGVDAAGSSGAAVTGSTLMRTGRDAVSGADDVLAMAYSMRVQDNRIIEAGMVLANGVPVSLPSSTRAAVRAGTGAVVSGNHIADSAYTGIWAQAGSQVSNNVVLGSCTVLDDCAGIYASGAGNNSVINGNLVINSRGALAGKAPSQAYTQAQGIYLDESASSVQVSNNLATGADNGLQLHVAANNTIQGNLFYGNRVNQVWMQETRNSDNPAGDLHGNRFTGNQVVATSATARALYLETTINDTARFATFDGNRYFDRIFPTVAGERTPSARTDYTLAQWKSATTASGAPRGLDATGSGTSETPFASVLVSGGTVVPNGDLAAGLAGWAAWSPVQSVAALQLEGCGNTTCLRHDSLADGSIVSSPNFSVAAGTWYRLSVALASSLPGQALDMVLRRGGGGANGYEPLADRSLRLTPGSGLARYSMIFKATKSVAAGDPVTLDLGARLDFQNLPRGLVLRLAGVELTPITPADAFTRSDLLLNTGTTPTEVACPVAASQPAQCDLYVRLLDDQPVTWPVTLPARSAQIVYVRDARLVDTDRDGIADSQDRCPGTTPGLAVNSAGCALQ